MEPYQAQDIEPEARYLRRALAEDVPHCTGYPAGVADAMDPNLVNGYRTCIPNGVVGGQLKDVVVQFLARNAPVRQEAALGLVAQAYQEGWPCR